MKGKMIDDRSSVECFGVLYFKHYRELIDFRLMFGGCGGGGSGATPLKEFMKGGSLRSPLEIFNLSDFGGRDGFFFKKHNSNNTSNILARGQR